MTTGAAKEETINGGTTGTAFTENPTVSTEPPPAEGQAVIVVENNVENAVSEVIDVAAAAVPVPVAPGLEGDDQIKIGAKTKKKRMCRFPGCTKVIKSQGHCQRHGAKAKRCKVEGCDKQAQGTHQGMCKRHWKAVNCPPPTKAEPPKPQPEGESVYELIIPASVAYRPPPSMPPGLTGKEDVDAAAAAASSYNENGVVDPSLSIDGSSLMPLIQFLREGRNKSPGWHRNDERKARGIFPVPSLSSQLEPWERQLAFVEILLLSGGTPYADFKDLAHAWGREKGFHHLLAQSICERRGDMERKKRSDAGRTMSQEQKLVFKEKLKKARLDTSPKEVLEETPPGQIVKDITVSPAIVNDTNTVPADITAQNNVVEEDPNDIKQAIV